MIGSSTYGKTINKKEERQHYAELLFEKFDYVEDLGHIDNISSCTVPTSTVADVIMNVRDYITTDGHISRDSLEQKEYGINHQYETFELIVSNDPIYIIGMRKLDDGYIYKTLFADYSKIDIYMYQNILIEADNLKRAIDIEEMNNEK